MLSLSCGPQFRMQAAVVIHDVDRLRLDGSKAERDNDEHEWKHPGRHRSFSLTPPPIRRTRFPAAPAPRAALPPPRRRAQRWVTRCCPARVRSGSWALMPHVKHCARHMLYPPKTPEKLVYDDRATVGAEPRDVG